MTQSNNSTTTTQTKKQADKKATVTDFVTSKHESV